MSSASSQAAGWPGRRSSGTSTKPLIPKLRRSYRLPDGAVLEVNHVDEGQPTEFWYAEVEYPTVEAACSWQPEAVGLADYLRDEVTDQPGQSMGAYWVQTRG